MSGYRETCDECMRRKLEDEMKAAERQPPSPPFSFRVWHTAIGGLTLAAFAIVAWGLIADHMRPSGLQVAIYTLCGMVILLGVVAGFVTVVNMATPTDFGKKWSEL